MGLIRSKAWMVGATVGAVEAMKDQGYCRWNSAMIRSLTHHASASFRSSSQAHNRLSSSSPSSSAAAAVFTGEAKAKQSEESLRQVMYLSCWGPN